MEYSLSASIMNVVLAIMLGIRDSEKLQNIFATSVSTQMSGYSIGKTKSHITKLGFFGVGCYYQYLSLNPILERYSNYQKKYQKGQKE